MKYVTVVLASLFILICACSEANSQDSSPREMSIEAVHELIESNQGTVVIDVRTRGEYDGDLGHIAGSHFLPVQEIETWAGQIDSLKSKQIVLVCHSGGRSGRAAKFLADKGFTNLINALGGMSAWSEKGFAVEKTSVDEE